MLGAFLKLLGFGNGASVVNTIAGGVNYTLLISLGTWAWTHREEQVSFTLSLGTLGLIVAIAWFALELNRRASYRSGSAADRESP